MTILTDLQQASFKGAAFLPETTTTTGGRKTVTHEFVNSSNRKVEDLGKQLKTFTLTGTITGDNYFQDKERLLNALEEPGQGILIHPFFGRIEAVAKPYILNEDLTTLGEAIFTMTFEKANDNVIPQPASSSKSIVSGLGDITNLSLAQDITDIFEVGIGFANSFSEGLALVNQVTNSFSNIISEFGDGNSTLIAQFKSDLLEFKNNASAFVNNPSALGAQILSLFDQSINILPTPDSRVDVLATFFDFNKGSDNLTIDTAVIGDLNNITAEKAEIVNNEKAITRQMQITSLSSSYVATSQIVFTNTETLDATQQLLDAQFQIIQEDPDIPNRTKLDLQNLRDQSEIFLQTQRLTVNQVLELDINRRPSQLLTYELYGNLDLANAIVDLNSNPDVSHYSGKIKVFTA